MASFDAESWTWWRSGSMTTMKPITINDPSFVEQQGKVFLVIRELDR
jgi:hypothetical protein